MLTVSVSETGSRLHELVARVEAGEVIALTRRGRHLEQIVTAAPVMSMTRAEQVDAIFRVLKELRRGVGLVGEVREIARGELD